MAPDTRKVRPSFVAILTAEMAMATFVLVIFGVFAKELIDAFSVSRAELGLLVTATAATGAVVSPRVGLVTDSIGPRRAAVLTFFVAAVSIAAVGAAPAFAWAAVAAAGTGIAQAMSNPSTNALIAHAVPFSRQGLVTGIKQSGVQVGSFIGGLGLPVLAVKYGWRVAVVVAGVVAAIGGVWASLALPAASGPTQDLPATPVLIPRRVRVLAVYGFFMGAGGSAIFSYLPLFGRERLGMSVAAAGGAVAATGVAGVIGRIGWNHRADRVGWPQVLGILAPAAAVAAILLVIAPLAGAWALWVAALVTGLSASAWNAVGMLGVIRSVPPAAAGRASGTVLAGFLAGLGGGAPVFGWSVDRLGGYGPGWWAVAGLFGVAWLVSIVLRRMVE